MNAVDELNMLLGIGPPKPTLPMTLQRSGYTPVRVLGKGSFGQAYLIFHKDSKQYYVAKHINMNSMSAKNRKDAHNEIHVLQQLQHPNIVRYVEFCEEHPHLYIVMEYADGGDLFNHLKQYKETTRGGCLPELQVINLFVQISMAVKYMHDRRLLHRDIKSQNIFLTKSHVVKLGDFGISTILQNTMAMAKTMCGTPCYFSPELCGGQSYNNKSDVWALGVLLYEMAGNKLPFESANMKGLMDDILTNEPPRIPRQYSDGLWHLIQSMLHKDPRARPDVGSVLRSPVLMNAIPGIAAKLSEVALFESEGRVPAPPPRHVPAPAQPVVAEVEQRPALVVISSAPQRQSPPPPLTRFDAPVQPPARVEFFAPRPMSPPTAAPLPPKVVSQQPPVVAPPLAHPMESCNAKYVPILLREAHRLDTVDAEFSNYADVPESPIASVVRFMNTLSRDTLDMQSLRRELANCEEVALAPDQFEDGFGTVLDIQRLQSEIDEAVPLNVSSGQQQQTDASISGMDPQIFGHCICGETTYQTCLSNIYGSFSCSCAMCTRFTGAGMIEWLHLPQVMYPEISAKCRSLAYFSDPVHGASSLYFCKVCGSSIAMEHAGLPGCVVAMSSLDVVSSSMLSRHQHPVPR